MTAFCILLILSVFHFALAAPVTIGEILEMRSNAVGAPEGGVAAWEKRVGTDDEDYDMSTNSNGAHRKDNPGGDSDLNDEPYDYNSDYIPGYGLDEYDSLRSESPWDSEAMESDGRGPDPKFLAYSDDEDRGAKPVHKVGVAKPNDKSDGEDGDGTGSGHFVHDDHDIGYDGDNNNNNNNNMDIDHSEHGSIASLGLGPGHPATPEEPEHPAISEEPDHPATPEEQEHPTIPERPENIPLMPVTVSDLEKILKFKPRNSGSGIMGTPKRALQGTVDTKAYVSDSPSSNNLSYKYSNPQFNG
jgi:hypothetical protein